MNKIHYIKFTFGTFINHGIPKEHLNYYKSFFSEYFNKEYKLARSKFQHLPTIPISYNKIAGNTDAIANKVTSIMKTPLNLINDDKIVNNIENEDLVVIDIKSSISDKVHIHLFSEIENILKQYKQSTIPRFVVVIDDIPSIENSYKSIKKYISAGQVVFIDKKKRFLYKKKITINRDFDFKVIAKSPLEKTKFKLIRKIGHFARLSSSHEGELIACNEFFYDGKDCYKDITEVLSEKIIEYRQKDYNVSKIIMNCPESDWLEKSIYHLDTELKINDFKKAYDLNYNGFIDSKKIVKKSMKKDNILLVLDLVHTGDSLKNTYMLVQKMYPKAKIKVLTVLVSDTKNKHVKINTKKKTITIGLEISGDRKIEAEYLLAVKQNRYPVYDTCPMCDNYHMKHIHIDSSIDNNTLTSFVAWTMFDEVKYGNEDYVTKRSKEYPDQVPQLPDRLAIMKENSAYLALKFEKLIAANQLSSANLTIIFPDETSSKTEKEKRKKEKRKKPINLEETASGYFAETLMQLKQIEYFGIPREILDDIVIEENKKPNLSFISDNHNEFYQKLRMISDDIIIMDEFVLSGTSMKKIKAVLSIVKKEPKAYFPIFNFNPKIIANGFADLNILSLYDFNLKTG